MEQNKQREKLATARRIVVKIGSRVLVQKTGRPDVRRLRELTAQLAELARRGHEIILVTSGAIAAGMQTLGMKKRPTGVHDLQMAAAVGQSRLMATYEQLFLKKGFHVGQVLLTHDDLKHRVRHLNARNTMMNLLRHGIIPVVNENDAVAVDEIKFGDNDLLASLVALLVEADLLILLTTVDGFQAPDGRGRKRRVPFLQGVNEETLSHAIGKGSELSTGGMASKLQSAGMALANGIPVVIANGRMQKVILRAAAGEDVGTLISAQTNSTLSHRKRWIAFFHKAKGQILVDNGAKEALLKKGRSLLPIGIKKVIGDFEAGNVVTLHGEDGTVLGRGLAEYGSNEIRLVKGRKTTEIADLLGSDGYAEIIHRDNIVFEN